MFVCVCVCVLDEQVTGNTLYNLVKFNDVPTDNGDRPLEPIKIFRTEVGNYGCIN